MVCQVGEDGGSGGSGGVHAQPSNPRAYAMAAMSQQDPDLDGEVAVPPPNDGGQPSHAPQAPHSIPERFAKVTGKLSQV